MLDEYLQKVYRAEQLTQQQSFELFSAVAAGELSDIQLAAVLMALKVRGETAAEVAGVAQAFLAKAKPFPPLNCDAADIVGTGGDGASTINISVTSALVASCCGAKIVKHGNRSVSSKSGASDLLNAFGYPLDLEPAQNITLLDRVNFCFLFAPHYHFAFKHAAKVRQALKTRTLFNILGPLVNPARPKKIMLGVYAKEIIPLVSQCLLNQGYQQALIVHGSGIDEVSLAGPTHVAQLKDGQITEFVLTAQDFGLNSYPLSTLTGGGPQENKEIITAILQGRGSQAQQSSIAANTALLLTLFGFNDLKANTRRVLELLAGDKVYTKLQQTIALAQQLRHAS